MIKFDRRAFLLGASTIAVLGWQTSIGNAQSGIDVNEAERMLVLNMVQLEDQLVKGLRLTTADQKQYIQVVLLAVQNGQIPRAMVNVVFVWSLERNAKYPFPCFRIALRTLAARRGVTLP